MKFGAECARFNFLSCLNLSFLQGDDSLSDIINCCCSFHLLAFAGLRVLGISLLNCKFHFLRLILLLLLLLLFTLNLGQVSGIVRCGVMSLLLSEVKRGISIIKCVRLRQRVTELEGSCLKTSQGKQGCRCVER